MLRFVIFLPLYGICFTPNPIFLGIRTFLLVGILLNLRGMYVSKFSCIFCFLVFIGKILCFSEEFLEVSCEVL